MDQRLEWLKPKMDFLFEVKAKQEARGKDLHTQIQAGREYRNPRICEKLLEKFKINQYGSNFPKNQFDPESWKQKPDAYYDSRLSRRNVEHRDREKLAANRHHHHHHNHEK